MQQNFLNHSSNKITFSYSWDRKLLRYIFVMVFGGLAIFLLTVYLLYVIRWLIGETVDPYLLWILPITIVLIAFFPAILANIEPDIQISQQGLRIQFFLLWWLFIPWDDIQEVRNSLSGLSLGRRVIIVRRLTIIHRLISWFTCLTLRPGFLISKRIDSFDDLMRIIRQATGEL